MMAPDPYCTRERGHHAANHKPPGQPLGIHPARRGLRMPAELESVDRLLDDPEFFEPYRAHFDPIWGRPSSPIETYLRMMFLKHRYRLGYETLCREVSDSIAWMRFCPHPLRGPGGPSHRAHEDHDPLRGRRRAGAERRPAEGGITQPAAPRRPAPDEHQRQIDKQATREAAETKRALSPKGRRRK